MLNPRKLATALLLVAPLTIAPVIAVAQTGAGQTSTPSGSGTQPDVGQPGSGSSDQNGNGQSGSGTAGEASQSGGHQTGGGMAGNAANNSDENGNGQSGSGTAGEASQSRGHQSGGGMAGNDSMTGNDTAHGAAQNSMRNNEAAKNDSQIQADVQKKLKSEHYSGVQSSVENGIVRLTGSVKLYDDKQQAEKKVEKVKNVVSVVNDIQVAAGETTDQQLQDKIARQLAYDRVGYGNVFNAITVSVSNGVATMGGHALGPVAKSSALNLASHTPGVTNVVDHIQVDPVSPMDDQLRVRVARTVYGYPSLNKYAINPANPIRITVVNGHVILSGVVDNKADKDVAGLQANTVPGVFSVTNNLQVANAPEERR